MDTPGREISKVMGERSGLKNRRAYLATLPMGEWVWIFALVSESSRSQSLIEESAPPESMLENRL